MRINFIDFVVGISKLCSRKFFLLNKVIYNVKNLKFFKVLELSEDKVLDVRLKLCKNLFPIRLMIDEQDEYTLNYFKSTVVKLIGQKKRMIVEQIKIVEEKIFSHNSNQLAKE